VQKPGLALAGFTEHVHNERVQVFGNTEMTYLATLAPARQREVLKGFFKGSLACLVVTKNIDIPAVLLEEAAAGGVPLLKTPLLTGLFIGRVQQLLEAMLMPRAACTACSSTSSAWASCCWARAASARASARSTW
jgi:HPr kinase/phosphorylase